VPRRSAEVSVEIEPEFDEPLTADEIPF